jgi:hypothetical protein
MKLGVPALLVVSACTAFGNNLVLNSGFETGDFTNWTVQNWAAFQIDPGYISGPQTGLYFVDTGCAADPCINGTQVEQAYLYQDLPTIVQNYDLTFFYNLGDCGGASCNPAQAEELKVLWGGQTVFDVLQSPIDPSPGAGWQSASIAVTGLAGTTRLEFLGRQDPGALALDDIVVITPEPSGLGCAGVAFLLIAGVYKRRRVIGTRS